MSLNRSHPDLVGRSSKRALRGAVLVFVVLLTFVLAGCRTPPPVPPQTTPSVAPPAELPAPGTALPETTPVSVTPAVEVSPAPAVTSLAEPPATGQPNRIVIPAIGLDAPMVDVGWKVVDRGNRRLTEWETADNAAGRHINSAKPGEQGNVVLSGHHNTKGEVFRSISEGQLAVGDLIYLYDDQGKRVTYVVTEVTQPLLEVGASEAQRLANARYIQPTSDARVTLVTCWPYYTNTHRVIVVGELVQ